MEPFESACALFSKKNRLASLKSIYSATFVHGAVWHRGQTSFLLKASEILNQRGEAMIHSRRDRKTKAIAEVLAMMANTHPSLAPQRPRPVIETDEWIFESATEFLEALEKYYAERATQIKRKHQ